MTDVVTVASPVYEVTVTEESVEVNVTSVTVLPGAVNSVNGRAGDVVGLAEAADLDAETTRAEDAETALAGSIAGLTAADVAYSPAVPSDWGDTPPAKVSTALDDVAAGGIGGGASIWVDVTAAPYNADKTGAVACTTAVQAAIDALTTAGGGVVWMPQGTYKGSLVCITANVTVIPAPGTIFTLDDPTAAYWFALGSKDRADAGWQENCALIGGPYTFDYTGLAAGSLIRGINVFNARNFRVEGARGLAIPDGNVVHISTHAGLSYPDSGIIEDIRADSAPWGYGAIQLTGGKHLSFRNITTDGGIALRVETDGAHGDGVEDVVADTICASGGANAHAAVSLVPHSQTIRNVTVSGIRAEGGADGVTMAEGPGLVVDCVTKVGYISGGGEAVVVQGNDQSFPFVTHRDMHVVGATSYGFMCAGQNFDGCVAESGATYGFWDIFRTAGHDSTVRPRFTRCKSLKNAVYGGQFLYSDPHFVDCELNDDPALLVPTTAQLLAANQYTGTLAGWTNGGGCSGVSNDGAGKLTWTASGVGTFATARVAIPPGTQGGSAAPAVTAGHYYRFSALVASGTAPTGAAITAQINWYNSSNVFISASTAAAVNTIAGGTVTASITAQAPTGATHAEVAFQGFSNVVGQTLTSGWTFTASSIAFAEMPGLATQNYGLNLGTGVTATLVATDMASNAAGESTGTGTVVRGYKGTRGTTGQVLTSNGASADPTFQAAAASGGTVTEVDSTTTALVVTNPTTTPSLAIADAVAGGASGLLSGADKTKLNNTSGTNSGDQDLSSYATSVAVAAGYQPLDSDLTALAALSTTSFGRSVLTQADASALRTLAGLGTAATSASTDFQPIDSDLTAIAGLSTTSFGRSILAMADAATVKTALALGNVDNTSDANKPVSTAQQAALDAKLDDTQLDTDSTFTANSDARVPSQKAVNTALAPLQSQQALLAGVTTHIGASDRWKAGPGLPATRTTGSLTVNGTSLGIVDAGIFAGATKRPVAIDDEVRFVTAGQTTTTLTLDANLVGLLGTTNASHSSGAPVKTRRERHIVWGPADSIPQGTNTGADPFVDRALRIVAQALGGHAGDRWPLWREAALGNSASEWLLTGSFSPVTLTTAGALSPWGIVQFTGGTGNFATWTRPAKTRVQCIDLQIIDEGAASCAGSYSLDGGSTWVDFGLTSVFGTNSYTLRTLRIRCDDPTSLIVRAANAAGTSKSIALPYVGIVTYSSYPVFGKTGGIVNHNLGWDGQTLRAALNARTVADAVANGTTTVTSATAAFVTADVGSTVMVNGVTTTISSRTNATTIVTVATIPTGTALNLTIFQGDHTSDALAIFDGHPGSIVPDLTVLWISPNDMGGTSTALGDNNPVAWQNMTQYIINRVGGYSDVLILAPYEMGGSGNSGSSAAYQALQATYRSTAKTLAATNGCLYLSLYDAFSLLGVTGYTAMNGAGYMFDTAHLAAKGQRLVGAELARVLLET